MKTPRLVRWLMRPRGDEQCPECGERVRQTHCDACGYDLIRKTRDSQFQPPVV